MNDNEKQDFVQRFAAVAEHIRTLLRDYPVVDGDVDGLPLKRQVDIAKARRLETLVIAHGWMELASGMHRFIADGDKRQALRLYARTAPDLFDHYDKVTKP